MLQAAQFVIEQLALFAPVAILGDLLAGGAQFTEDIALLGEQLRLLLRTAPACGQPADQ